MVSSAAKLETRDAVVEDFAAVLDVRTRSFGPLDAGSQPAWERMQEQSIAQRRALVVTAADRVVGYARIHQMQQLWGGRPVPMAGVAGVVVAPEHRGRGVGTLLMRAVLERAVELGDAVSVLYPATLPVYRRLGWEWAGGQHRVSIDTAMLRRLGGHDVAVRPAAPGDEHAMLATVTAFHERGRTSGPLVHTVEELREELADAGVFSYHADDGVLQYGWHDQDLLVHELTAATEQTARALWSVVGSGSSTARTVHAYQPPRDPLHFLLGVEVRAQVTQTRWMLRVLDLPAAVGMRGFPRGLHTEVRFVVDDPLVPSCSGSWLLRVADGRGEIAAADSNSRAADSLLVGPNGLAAMFAGTPLATIRTGGLGSGGNASDDAMLDAAFAGEPYLLDYF